MSRSRSNFARPIVAVLGSVLLISAALAACNSDGRTLRPADPSQNQSVYTPTTTTVPTTSIDSAAGTKGSQLDPLATSTTTAGTDAASSLTLQLPWADGGAIDQRFTCKGAGVHPQISWSGASPDTVELALVVTDIDANDYVQWIIAGLQPTENLISEGVVPVGAIQSLNGSSTAATPATGWSPPCPPAGSTHHYWFTLYALSQQVELPNGSASADMLNAIEDSSIDASEITGVYTAP